MSKQETRTTFYWNSLVIKFGKFMSHYKRKMFIKKSKKNVEWQATSSRPICVYKKISTTSTGRCNFQTNWLYWICHSKTIKTIKTSCRLPQIPFYSGIVNILKNNFEVTFFVFNKKLLFVKLHKMANSITTLSANIYLFKVNNKNP